MTVGVIFQGGGAKLVSLLAAASVIEDMAAADQFEVAATAGTSAGAFAAFALASKHPVSHFVQRCQIAGNDLLPKIEEQMKLNFFRRAGLGLKILQGHPIMDERILQSFATAFTAEAEQNLSALPTPIYICATNLNDGERVVFHSGNTNDKSATCLTDSASIPFFFRSAKSQSRGIVDGGICSNLPDNTIFGDTVDEVIAVSFESESVVAPGNIWNFAGSLLSTSISHSMVEASSRIRAAGGAVVSLPRSLGTLDFHVALETINSPSKFKAQKDLARVRIADEIANVGFGMGSDVSQLPAHLIREHNPLYDAIKQNFPYRSCSAKLLAMGLSLRNPCELPESFDDELIKIVEFEPVGSGSLAMVRVSITSGDGQINDSAGWFLEDREGREVASERVVFTENVTDKARALDYPKHYSVYVLKEPLPKDRCPLKVVQTTYHKDLFDGLRTSGVDCIRIKINVHDATVHDIVAAVPKEFGSVKVSDLTGQEHRLDSPTALPHIQESKDLWSAGKQMTFDDIGDELRRRVRERSADLALIGWRVHQAKPDTWAGCLLEKVPS